MYLRTRFCSLGNSACTKISIGVSCSVAQILAAEWTGLAARAPLVNASLVHKLVALATLPKWGARKFQAVEADGAVLGIQMSVA
mmetsp:Transcript_92845/g.174814  ORF Transcript_92845/g.174814 Transcript_92845/m.174814 type:complete len:84 (-) Transcript_92845:4900-5151(-)